MVEVLHFYMDDSGTRHPDHKVGRVPKHGYDWFTLGGILIDQKDEIKARDLYSIFCNKWNISWPLHSSEIRSMSGNFRFLMKLDKEDKIQFYEELYRLMAEIPCIGIAGVIDRSGYNARYRDKYGRQRWKLCKTAFSVSVERAAKYALKENKKLKIFPERSDKNTDRIVKTYYQELKKEGMPFSKSTSGKYDPLSVEEFSNTLYDFKCKNKTSPMIQIADLYVWPMSIGGYDSQNRPYSRLRADRKLIDDHLSEEEVQYLGIKYSCFENIKRK